MKNLLFLIPFLLFQGLLIAQEKKRTLFLNAGMQNSWDRDLAYSPLIYSGGSAGFTLGYSNASEKKTDEVYLHFANHNKGNDTTPDKQLTRIGVKLKLEV